MLGIAGLTEPTVKELKKVKDRTHTVAAKESQAQAPEMSHPILQRAKMSNSLFEVFYVLMLFKQLLFFCGSK
jgi:hypothetical protein